MIKLHKVPQGRGHCAGGRVNTLRRMRAGDASGHVRASEVVSRVLLLDLSNSYESVYCVNNVLFVAFGGLGI